MFLIPIGHEDQRVARLPWVTIGLVAVNVAIFIISHSLVERQSVAFQTQFQEVVRFASEHPYLRLPEELAQGIPAEPPPTDLSADTIADRQAQLDRLVEDLRTLTSRSLYRTYGYIPAHPSVLTLFTSMFLHGGWLHLIGNMLFLWLAGASLEDRWGRVLYPVLYLASGVAAALTHQGMQWQSTIPMVGASGAIAGLMGAFLVRLATTRIRFLYWFFFLQGTFEAPAYVVLPLWLLQQFAMASQGPGNVAVWAHIGGFVLGGAAALLIRGTDLEARFLAPAIEKKTVWTASERLTAAMERLDRGDADGAIQALQALLRTNPNSIEIRTSLVAAHERKGDQAAAGKESAKLVGAYVWARDGDGALAAAQEHDRAHREVPLFMRDLLALATFQEKRGQHAEAAQLYQRAISAWPDDPLTPKALLAYGRSMLENYGDPGAALELLERSRTHPKVPPEVRKASEELIAKARRAVGPEASPPQAAPRRSRSRPSRSLRPRRRQWSPRWKRSPRRSLPRPSRPVPWCRSPCGLSASTPAASSSRGVRAAQAASPGSRSRPYPSPGSAPRIRPNRSSTRWSWISSCLPRLPRPAPWFAASASPPRMWPSPSFRQSRHPCAPFSDWWQRSSRRRAPSRTRIAMPASASTVSPPSRIWPPTRLTSSPAFPPPAPDRADGIEGGGPDRTPAPDTFRSLAFQPRGP